MAKINIYLDGIPRADSFSETEQQDIVNEAVNMQLKGDQRTFRDIVENLVFIKSIEMGRF